MTEVPFRHKKGIVGVGVGVGIFLSCEETFFTANFLVIGEESCCGSEIGDANIYFRQNPKEV